MERVTEASPARGQGGHGRARPGGLPHLITDP
jgi:hypothetical protein